MSIAAKIGNVIKRQFISGLLVAVPVIVTYFVLRFLFDTLDGLLSPVVERLLGHHIPGLGAVATIALILIAGIITRNFIGARLYLWGDTLLAGMPLVRSVYSAAKKLSESMLSPQNRAFSEVVLVEYPRTGLYAIGFLAHRSRVVEPAGEKRMAVVFVPTTPTPFTGTVLLVPEKDVYPVDMSVEEGIKLVVSGGIVSPDTVTLKSVSKMTR